MGSYPYICGKPIFSVCAVQQSCIERSQTIIIDILPGPGRNQSDCDLSREQGPIHFSQPGSGQEKQTRSASAIRCQQEESQL